MDANPFDQFDTAPPATEGAAAPAGTDAGTNPFDQFDTAPPAVKPHQDNLPLQVAAGVATLPTNLASTVANVATNPLGIEQLGTGDDAPAQAIAFNNYITQKYGPPNPKLANGWDDATRAKAWQEFKQAGGSPTPKTANENAGTLLQKGLSAAHLNPEDYFPQPQSPAERIARATGEGAASMLIPVEGEINAAKALGNAAVGAISGAGGQTAAELAPDEFKPLANLAGALVTGGAGVGALEVGKFGLQESGKAWMGLPERIPLPGGKSFPTGSKTLAERAAANYVQNAAEDPAALRTSLETMPTDTGVPGFQPNLYQATNDGGIGVLSGVIDRAYPEAYAARRAAQAQAWHDALANAQPEGQPAAAADVIRQQMDELDNLTGAQQERALSQVNRSLGPDVPATDAAEQVRNTMQSVSDARDERISDMYKALDPAGTMSVVSGPLKRASASVYDNLPEETQSSLSPYENEVQQTINSYGPTLPLRNLMALKSRISQEMMAANSPLNPNRAAAGRLAQLRGAVENAIDDTISGQVADDQAAVSAGQMAPEDTLYARLLADKQNWLANRNTQGNVARADIGEGANPDVAGGSPAVSGASGAEGEAGSGLSGSPSGAPVPAQQSPAVGPSTPVLGNVISRAKNAGVDMVASEGPSQITLSKIVVPKAQRGAGLGTNAMKDLIDYADATGKTIALTPSDSFGGSLGRLRKFYKGLGFVENRGRNKDFSTRETMLRPPVYPQAGEKFSPQAMRGKLPESASLSTPPPPTKADLDRASRVEDVPLAQARGTQPKMDWKRFKEGDHPDVLVPGYGDKPVAVRREDGEYLIFDGHHRTTAALNEGRDTLPMHVIDAKDYAPDLAGRKPQPSSGPSDDELLKELGVSSLRSNPQRLDADTAQQLRAATAATKELRTQQRAAPVSSILQREGATFPYKMSAGTAATNMWKAGPKGADAVRNMAALAQNHPDLAEGLSNLADNSLRSETAKSGLTTEALAAWRTKYAPALDELERVAPGTQARYDTVAHATDALAEAQRIRQDSVAAYEKSVLGKFINARDDAEVVRHVDNILGGTASVRDMRALVREIGHDPDALSGLRRAVTDAISRRAESTVATTRSGTPALSAAQFNRFVTKAEPALREVMTPEQIDTLRAISQTMRQASRTVNIAGQSGTHQFKEAAARFKEVSPSERGTFLGNILGRLTPRIGAAIAGGGLAYLLSPSIFTAALGAGGAELYAAMRQAGITHVNDVVRQMIQDPAFARDMLRKVPMRDKAGAWTPLLQRLKKLSMASPVIASQQPTSAASAQ